MRLFDTHTHIQFPAYDHDREAVIERARQAGVKMICVGTQASTSRAGTELAGKYPNDIWTTVGYHPAHVSDNWYHDKKEQKEPEREEFDPELLEKLGSHPKVVAIGECGLDYFRLGANREAQIADQKKVFLEQIRIAERLKKPLMMHTRPSKGSDDAYEDTLKFLEQARVTVPKINHFYVGSLAVTRKLLEAGFYFTFGGVITFARDYDEIIKYISLDRIMLETDAPYVAPAPYRGKRNEPAYVVETAKKIAEIKNVSVEQVVEATNSTVRKVFGI